MSFQNNSKNYQVPEFLRQLVKMLKEKKNSEMIVWEAGRIVVYDPSRLAQELLHQHYNHSNFSSFQRQLNSFGFKKVALKIDSTTSPCCFNNQNTTSDLLSLLHLKRRKGLSTPKSASLEKISYGENFKKRKYYMVTADQHRDSLIQNEFINRSNNTSPSNPNVSNPPSPPPTIPKTSRRIDVHDSGCNSNLNSQTQNDERIGILGQNFQQFSDLPQNIVNGEPNLKIGSPTETFLEILSSYVECDEGLKQSDPYEPIPLEDVMSKHANEFYANLSKHIYFKK